MTKPPVKKRIARIRKELGCFGEPRMDIFQAAEHLIWLIGQVERREKLLRKCTCKHAPKKEGGG